ncbi:lytic transglycosylase domain-containing protein [Neobacillus terrae]|uniref:lytic transglycosylase domain-containing protein n=1 Tax=Neobacillus terrae TaxID=3034837 RepID=UPI00140C76D2|nr:transglycosylase SLT domain-containing protein [Neobacillus terrae]NHM32974.1 transglycosylase SLT domain-containing protein [Neobacillus terrae]
MSIDKLKAMLELKAFQGFGSSSEEQDNSNMFTDLLNQLLGDQERPSFTSDPSNQGSTDVNLVNDLTLPEISNTVTPMVPGLIAANSLGWIGKAPIVPPAGTSQNQNSSQKYDDIIEKASRLYQVPAKLIRSVMQHESSFNPNAVSRTGASGLMQLMPGTARAMGAENTLDPEQNILAGTKYLRQLMDKYDGNIHYTIAAYNAGPGNVDKYGGIPPFKETQNYVRKVTGSFLA